MNEKNLIIFTGNVGSGKSTKARELAKQGYVIINADSITQMIGGGEYGLYDEKKKPIYKGVGSYILGESLRLGFSVAIDRTCMSKKSRDVYILVGLSYDAHIISYDWGPGKLEYLRRRMNDPRDGNTDWNRVYIKLMQEYEKPSFVECFDEIIEMN